MKWILSLVFILLISSSAKSQNSIGIGDSKETTKESLIKMNNFISYYIDGIYDRDEWIILSDIKLLGMEFAPTIITFHDNKCSSIKYIKCGPKSTLIQIVKLLQTKGKIPLKKYIEKTGNYMPINTVGYSASSIDGTGGIYIFYHKEAKQTEIYIFKNL